MINHHSRITARAAAFIDYFRPVVLRLSGGVGAGGVLELELVGMASGVGIGMASGVGIGMAGLEGTSACATTSVRGVP